MQIQINQHIHSVTDGTSLQALVSEYLKLSSKGIAIAINQEVIPKNLWEKTLVQSNDSILIIKATQGG